MGLKDVIESVEYATAKRRFHRLSFSMGVAWLDSAFYAIRLNLDEFGKTRERMHLEEAREATIIVLASIDDLLDRTR